MGKLFSLKYFAFLITILLAGCNNQSTESIDVTAVPVVKKSSVNYNQETFLQIFPDTTSLKNIGNAYSNNYTNALREQIIYNMRVQVLRLGEDINKFDSILSLTGCFYANQYMLPTYAERAKYEEKEVWVFQLTYGLSEPVFAHYRCFVFGVENLDTLAYTACK
jgi:hypothetical protein